MTLNRQVLSLINNFMTSRAEWVRRVTGTGCRDIDRECNFPVDVTAEMCGRAFERGDIAKRIVSVFPEESWQNAPAIYETENEDETEFEKQWQALQEEHNILQLMQRADLLSGIGRFGVILLGIGDNVPNLNLPVDGLDAKGESNGGQQRDLLYMRPLDERLVKVKKWESNPANPRFGKPVEYEIQFDADMLNTGVPPAPGKPTSSLLVHWHRVIHLADNRTNNDIFGEPRMKVVYNRLLGLATIAGASPEMFWKGGFPGMFFGGPLETKEGRKVEIDIDSVKEEYQNYINDLQRILVAEGGVTAQPLTVQIEDPASHVDIQFTLISAALGIPKRILMGSEQSQLASGQDKVSWNERLNRRREDYLSPFVVRPVLSRLMNVGILPKVEKVFIDWPDLNSPSEQERADVASKKTDALVKYVAGGANVLIGPFHYLTTIMDYTDKEAESILAEAQEEPEEPEPAPQE